jgi:hypothetical protein
VAKGYNEILEHSNQKFKRNKSADPVAKENPTYIQKLLGLNRTESQSKYAHAIPSWQKLLKTKQQALVQTLQPGRKQSFGANEVSMTDINATDRKSSLERAD